MRSLLASTLLLLPGCALFRDPLTVPVDIVIRPKVGVEIETETLGAASSLDWQTGGMIVLGILAVVVIAKFAGRRAVK